MSVIESKYLSALGKRLCSLCLIFLLVSVVGCGGEKAPSLPDEKFQQIYGDILLLGELHRSDSTALRHSLDSLLDAHGIDTTILFASARETALDPARSEALYRVVVERFEKKIGRSDSTEVKTAPPLGFD